MRIALIADWQHAVAEPFAGGLEAHVWSLSSALTARGHYVTLFAGQGSDTRAAGEVRWPTRLRLSAAARGDSSMPAGDFMYAHHAYLTLLLGLGSKTSGTFEVIHNHSLHHLPIAMAPTIATPMLTTLHTPPTPWLESAIKAASSSSMRYVAVSEHTAREWRPIAGPVQVVYNGIDPIRWPKGEGGDELIWFGRITAEKGTHLAVEAARRAGRHLLLAGPVADRSYYEQWVEPELGHGATYLGHLVQSDLAKHVGRCAATLVTPVWDEPYALVIAESMSCGTPVVAFRRGGMPELIGSTGGVVVEPGDVVALAAAIPRAAQLSRAGVAAHARTRCSIASMVDQYEYLYDELHEMSS